MIAPASPDSDGSGRQVDGHSAEENNNKSPSSLSLSLSPSLLLCPWDSGGKKRESTPVLPLAFLPLILPVVSRPGSGSNTVTGRREARGEKGEESIFTCRQIIFSLLLLRTEASFGMWGVGGSVVKRAV